MYLNRNNCINGYSCSVHLSAHIEEYPGTLATEKEIHAPKFIGYGITAEFHITSHVMATLTYGFSDPEWHIKDTDNNTDLLIIPGMECDLDIKIKPNQYEEMVDLRFLGEGGQYSWHGLPESNLPSTHMDVDIDYTNAFTGEVNHTPYSVYGNEWKTFSITEGVSGNLVYDSGGTIPEGDFSAYVRYSAHTGWQVSNSYRAEAVSTDPYGNTYNHWLQIDSTGNSINIAGEYLRGMTDFYCNVDITDMPTSYKYSLKDRTGLDLSNASFIDVNGKNWTGATSPEICYKGVQTVTARGNWNYTGHTETASPSFDRSNKWDYNDPAPSSLGGISCTNTPVLNSYSITVYDEDTEEETTYLPGRVGIYAPLGSNLDSEGSMSFSYTAQVEIDDFSDGWTMLERTVSKSGFTRAPYTGEHIPEGYNTADYLIPHMPLGNLITLHGAGFTQEEVNYEPNKVSLVIKAKNKSYYYLPVSITNTDIVWDLTYPDPDKYAGSDEGIRYSPDHLPENFEHYFSGL